MENANQICAACSQILQITKEDNLCLVEYDGTNIQQTVLSFELLECLRNQYNERTNNLIYRCHCN